MPFLFEFSHYFYKVVLSFSIDFAFFIILTIEIFYAIETFTKIELTELQVSGRGGPYTCRLHLLWPWWSYPSWTLAILPSAAWWNLCRSPCTWFQTWWTSVRLSCLPSRRLCTDLRLATVRWFTTTTTITVMHHTAQNNNSNKEKCCNINCTDDYIKLLINYLLFVWRKEPFQ